MSRRPLVAGNWKLNHLIGASIETASSVKGLLTAPSALDIVVCPVFTALQSVAETLQGSPIEVGGQNCYVKESGAFTGEVSPQMLLDAGCAWVIIGHSERRHIFGETDTLLNEKLKFARSAGLKVMFCIGETLEEREAGKMNDVLSRQVSKGLEGIDPGQFDGIAIAYEPVWAIGTGVTATPQQAQDAHAFVRGLLNSQLGGTIADTVRIQYGGSVKPDNAAELMRNPDVDGFLVGGAALKADSFAAIVNAAI
ncbi:MAG: triose-phosphate isomerase [Candidatus Hydrogenedentes bacterium]|nr:triose-phosphate isomerase [Candidatus Hydrogenedentota bacterium]